VKRFRFKLEKALEFRAHREQEAKTELGKAVGSLTLIEQRIRAVAEDRSQAASQRFSPENRIHDMRQYDLYILRLDALKDKLLSAAVQAEQKVDEARELYLGASRDRKVLDKVKERKAGEYRKTRSLDEIKAQDDLPNKRGSSGSRESQAFPI